VVYADGIVKHTGVLAIGGDHVSNDLAYGLKLPLGRAEQLKIDHGSALVDRSDRGQTIQIPNDLGLPEKSVNLEHLRRIMSLRLEEIFQLVAHELESAGLIDFIRSGIFLCGGGARVPGIQTLAQRVFGLQCSIGKSNSISGVKSALDQPEFAAAIGLAKFGSFEYKKRSEEQRPFAWGIKSTVGQWFKRG
jgi:cell division protein FtsA